MSRREQVLILVGFIIIVLLGFYYLIYTPRMAEYNQLTAERDTRQARLDQMQRVAAQTEQLEARYAELKTFISTIEAKLPTEKEVPALLVQMERLVNGQHVDLQALRPGALEAVAAQGQAAQPAAGTQPAAPAQPAQGRPEYYRFPINMQFAATYNEFVSLMAALKDFPRLIAVTRVSMAPVKLPDLSVQTDTETYVLPKEAP
ncbi:MAG TPA: type 4a pilus biogenesis protein PilO [bacterium]